MEQKQENNYIKVHCPNCKNKRLFDLYGKASGTLKIKCPVCRKEVNIHLDNCNEQRQQRLTTYYQKVINEHNRNRASGQHV